MRSFIHKRGCKFALTIVTISNRHFLGFYTLLQLFLPSNQFLHPLNRTSNLHMYVCTQTNFPFYIYNWSITSLSNHALTLSLSLSLSLSHTHTHTLFYSILFYISVLHRYVCTLTFPYNTFSIPDFLDLSLYKYSSMLYFSHSFLHTFHRNTQNILFY